jgi:hypothetical protein
MAEPSPGHYTGYCPFPPYVDLSKLKLCTDGTVALQNFCDVVNPSIPLPGFGLNPQVACSGLIFVPPPFGIELVVFCEVALVSLQLFCKVFTNSIVQNALCGPPPASVKMNTVVTDLVTQFVLADQVSIQPAGPPVPVVLGPYQVFDSCTPRPSNTSTSIPASAPPRTATPTILPPPPPPPHTTPSPTILPRIQI